MFKSEIILRQLSEVKIFQQIWVILKYLGGVAGLIALLSFFGFTGNWIKDFIIEQAEVAWLISGIRDVPLIVWLIIVIGGLYVILLRHRVNLVAGTFKDDFSHGLVNWEYAGEGWTTQRGENGYELSVTNSSDGGISNIGMNWDSYVFSFDCRIINRNIGWIVRATDRNNYIMFQLSDTRDNDDYVTLNPHYRAQGVWMVSRNILNASEELIRKIKAHKWLGVKIIVFGNTVDIFIDGERVLNHHIHDPLRAAIKEDFTVTKDDNSAPEQQSYEKLHSFSFPSGRVGFRCFQTEHALIRNVRVQPKLWNSKGL